MLYARVSNDIVFAVFGGVTGRKNRIANPRGARGELKHANRRPVLSSGPQRTRNKIKKKKEFVQTVEITSDTRTNPYINVRRKFV